MRFTKTLFSAALALSMLAAHPASLKSQTALPVFPGAEGFGTTTVAGRGGVVHRVTNLHDSGPGSLRAAIDAYGPRVVIFEVAGTIRLRQPLKLRNPYITIAGQTAPSPGITLRDMPLWISTHDILIQHLRFRVGDAGLMRNPDALWLMYGSSNVVVDHNSFSWAIDENVGVYGRDITLSNNIVSEALSHSLNSNGEHSKGSLLGDGSHRISFIRNLSAHNRERNPQFSGNVSVLVANNVNYNPGSIKGGMYFSNGYRVRAPTRAAVVGNVLLPGRDTAPDLKMVWITSAAYDGSALYVHDNLGPDTTANPWAVVKNDAGPRLVAANPPLWTSPLTVLRSDAVLAHVLANAGARPRNRDAVDSRIVSEVQHGTGSIIDTPSQVGGWPMLAETTRHLTLPINPNGDADRDGYTNLEEWLHGYSAGVEGRPSLSAPTGLRTY